MRDTIYIYCTAAEETMKEVDWSKGENSFPFILIGLVIFAYMILDWYKKDDPNWHD